MTSPVSLTLHSLCQKSVENTDPHFVREVFSHQSKNRSTPAHLDYWRDAASLTYPQLRRTDFQLELDAGTAKKLWPDKACLISIDVRKDIDCVRRLYVWQGEGVLLCAVCESTPRLDVISGNFFSGNDPFALDSQSEMHAIGYHNLARRMIIEASVDVIAPMASYDLGIELGKALAKRLNTSSAERFMDGLVDSLLSEVKPTKK